jgi:hypothetical protein
MRVRIPFAIFAILAIFAGGQALSRWLEREASARQPQTTTLYVPPDGLTFRALDGHAVARLSYDAHGGIFEVYDDHERPTAALRPGLSRQGALPASSVAALPGMQDLGY